MLCWNSGWVEPELEWAGAECGQLQLLEVRSHRMPTTAEEEEEEWRELEGFM